MPKCKNCKGEGFVHPMITMECNMCYNNDEGKKTCCECMGKGWETRAVSQICATCGGSGKT